MKTVSKTVMLVVVIGGLVWLGIALMQRLNEPEQVGQKRAVSDKPIPVEVQEVRKGLIEQLQLFSGSLEAPARVMVSPKVSGRITKLLVDISDEVTRGQVVAELDNDEYQQAVAQADAGVAVAQAKLTEAESRLKITKRELERLETLSKRGIASDAQLDEARGNLLRSDAAVQVAKAQLLRDQSSLATAKIRLNYTRVTADWTDGDAKRVLAERMVEVGDTVAANTPLVSVVELNPIQAVITVTEVDYRFLKVDQRVSLRTDAYPGETFEGRISRLAPVFDEASRQARVELIIKNEDQRLKPGMFVRVAIILDRDEQATIIPDAALTTRDDKLGLFLVSPDGKTVKWQPVEVGIRSEENVQIISPPITGHVVTLGQQMIEDGSKIIIPDANVGNDSSTKESDG